MTKYSSSYKQKSFSKKPKTSSLDRKIKMFNIFLVAVIGFLGSYYVALANDLTVRGLEVQNLNYEVSSLKEQNRGLNVKVTSLKSYNNLSQRTDSLKMVSAEDARYLDVPSDVLAQR